MIANGPSPRGGRETRILLLVVAVSIAVLLLLARFRFPAAALPTIAPTPGPLISLASRATFEDLAETLRTLLIRIEPRLVVVEFEAAGSVSGQGAPTPALGLALRMRADLAVVHVPPNTRLRSAPGSVESREVVAHDPARGLAVVRVTGDPDFRAVGSTAVPFPGFAYVGVATATRTGPTIQPVFVGRVGQVATRQWSANATTVGDAASLAAGSLVFATNAECLGLVVEEGGHAILIPTAALETALLQLVPSTGAGP